MDIYAPELAALCLKRRRDSDRDPLAMKVQRVQSPSRAFRIMDLPAGMQPYDFELLAIPLTRNRASNHIYDYAAEEVPSNLLTPVTRCQTDRSLRPKGIELTQVSRQVRSEYRPIWLKDSTFVIDWHVLGAFTKVFYPKEEDYNGGPKSMVVQYDSSQDFTLRTKSDITTFVRLGLFLMRLRCVLFMTTERSKTHRVAASSRSSCSTAAPKAEHFTAMKAQLLKSSLSGNALFSRARSVEFRLITRTPAPSLTSTYKSTTKPCELMSRYQERWESGSSASPPVSRHSGMLCPQWHLSWNEINVLDQLRRKARVHWDIS
jgi:hypothetical protein